MKEIKAFIHRNRAAEVVSALEQAGFHNFSLVDVRGTLKALNDNEKNYSVGTDGKIITKVKLELVCRHENRATEAIHIIQEQAQTGQPEAGWIYISDIQAALPIG